MYKILMRIFALFLFVLIKKIILHFRKSFKSKTLDHE